MDNPYQPPQSASDPVRLEPLVVGRPASVTVFGILNVVFGALGVACTPFSLMTLFIPQPAGAPANPMADLMKGETYRGILIGSAAVGWIASGVLLAAGVGLLKERAWGRKLSLGYGIYSIVWTVFGTAVNFVYLVQPLMEAAKQDKSPQLESSVMISIASVLGGLVGLIYPVLLLVFMTRPRVVAFLDRSRPGDSDYFRMTPT